MVAKVVEKEAWGTNILFAPQILAAQNLRLTKMVKWYTPAKVLKLVGADNAELHFLAHAILIQAN